MKFGMYVCEEPTILHVEFGSDRPTGLAVARFFEKNFSKHPLLRYDHVKFFFGHILVTCRMLFSTCMQIFRALSGKAATISFKFRTKREIPILESLFRRLG